MIHIGIIGLGAIGQRLIKQFTEHEESRHRRCLRSNETLAKETAKD